MDVRVCIVSGDRSMSDKNINIEKDGHVLDIRFTNDEMSNSLSPAMRYGLANAIHQGAGDHTVRALDITGSGQSFCAGGDFETLSKFNDSHSTHNRLRHMSSFLTQISQTPKSIFMGVNGYAVGGGMGLAFESFGQPLAFRTRAFQEGFKAVKSKADANFPAASDREYWHKRLAKED